MGPKRALRPENDEWMSSTGQVIQLCVAHELDDEATESVRAIGVYEGFSLCREHLIQWNFFGIHQISSKNG